MEAKEKPSEPILKNKHTDDLIDHYWGSINYVAGLIKASELKAGLNLSFYGILLNFIYQSIRMAMVQTPSQIVLFIFLGLWFCCTVTSIYFSIRCFIPRIEATYEKNIFLFPRCDYQIWRHQGIFQNLLQHQP